MAQACTVSHADNKRSLPAWMLKACSVNEAPKTKDQNKEALESSVKIGVVDQTNPIKRKTGRHLKNVDSEGASELVGLQRCEGREKARRKSKAAVKDDIEEIRDVTIKKERKASEGAALKNNRKRKLENIKSEASSPVSIDDDIELTVEDLVSIAEEYVNADKQKQHELEAVKGTRHKEHLPCPAFLTEADTGVSVVNAPPMKGLLQCTTVESNTRSGEHRRDENKSHQELRYSSSLETTEDVAQDMLNLFLGHLWNKPAGNAKKSEPVESITRTTDNHVPEETGWHSEVPKLGESVKKTMPLESMTTTINHVAEKDCHSEQPKLAEPVKKSMPLGSLNTTMNHVPEKKDWRSELPKLGEPVITKKKSSLRDKVALFL